MGRKFVVHNHLVSSDPWAARIIRAPLHPLTRELMAVLPPPGTAWPKHKQEAYLKAADAIFDLLYEDDEPDTSPPQGGQA